ncbi:hypothetical protein R0137_02180 [Congregibacter brevis]|uniref:SnoaL-like domain-containing protein n=1 Tax=Congregibacter brevis TaxID=3081201 RepID=A0ABZ0ID79_9GAMM|nr:hypothetical protein R0137_02180 [Congregibacter sp. IMCC45268]
MYLSKLVFIVVLVLSGGNVFAGSADREDIEREASDFFDAYLAVYNKRFGHPERSAQFRQELSDLVQMPLLISPPMSAPQTAPSKEAFAKNFEGFVKMLEGKSVTRLEWQETQFHVLTDNKVLANNVGFGYTDTGEIAYETVSLYLIYRHDDSWKIAMFSPYDVDSYLQLARP